MMALFGNETILSTYEAEIMEIEKNKIVINMYKKGYSKKVISDLLEYESIVKP